MTHHLYLKLNQCFKIIAIYLCTLYLVFDNFFTKLYKYRHAVKSSVNYIYCILKNITIHALLKEVLDPQRIQVRHILSVSRGIYVTIL